ncbi:MAG: hypothetical protein HY645_09130 [Acidobacteria bacterium]|nr:hypothetical protein [Acidobacteriota bacterium]
MRKAKGPIFCLTFLILFVGSAVRAGAANELSQNQFQQTILDLSEAAGFFDTDNLVSNENSYLHVAPRMRLLAKPGAYVGVGPDQNFTYIAHTRPVVVFVVDVRRDNLLLHLYLKELFQASHNRWNYLSYLFGKPLPKGFKPPANADARLLAAHFRSFPSDRAFFQRNFQRFWSSILDRYPRIVRAEDRKTFYAFASTFFEQHLELRYTSHGTFPRPYYPSYEQLMTETDLGGKMGHYLNQESDFRFVKKMHTANLIIPVIGDFAGPTALKSVARFLRKERCTVSTFYLSNVEYYLFRDGTYGKFLENVQALPLDQHSIVVRSYFSYLREHPETVPGYYVTSLVQRAARFLELSDKKPYLDYWDMVSRDYIPNVKAAMASFP